MNVYVFGYDKSYASSMVNLIDIFSQAHQLCVTQHPRSVTEEIKVHLASVDGKPIRCQNGILLNADCSLDEIQKADVFIVTAILDFETVLAKHNFIVDWLKKQYQKGTTLASICTGAFLLAETGLLDGKDATTHWAAVDAFRDRYPQIRLTPEKLVINHNRLYCAGGAGASNDLAYCLVENFLGHTLAARTAKFFIHDFRRESQRAYTIYENKTGHGDAQILTAQEWINRHLNVPISVEKLSRIACMSQRTFERKFKKATGDSPLMYIQRMKVEVAKQKLETTHSAFDEIAYEMGYQNSGSFRKIFVKWVNLLPSEYRKRFRTYEVESHAGRC